MFSLALALLINVHASKNESAASKITPENDRTGYSMVSTPQHMAVKREAAILGVLGRPFHMAGGPRRHVERLFGGSSVSQSSSEMLKHVQMYMLSSAEHMRAGHGTREESKCVSLIAIHANRV